MFNFSANNVEVLVTKTYARCIVYELKDMDTSRVYKAYDYSKSLKMQVGVAYCISGKVNSADKLYLILEHCKVDRKSSNTAV